MRTLSRYGVVLLLQVTLVNVPEDFHEKLEAPNFPRCVTFYLVHALMISPPNEEVLPRRR